MGKSKDEAIEELRRKCVYSMKSGDNLVLFVDKMSVDFKTVMCDKDNFPADLIFNFAEFRKTENYKKILRGDEDKDVFGNKGLFELKDTFAITVLATYTDEEHIQKVLESLPNLDNFEKAIIE